MNSSEFSHTGVLNELLFDIRTEALFVSYGKEGNNYRFGNSLLKTLDDLNYAAIINIILSQDTTDTSFLDMLEYLEKEGKEEAFELLCKEKADKNLRVKLQERKENREKEEEYSILISPENVEKFIGERLQNQEFEIALDYLENKQENNKDGYWDMYIKIFQAHPSKSIFAKIFRTYNRWNHFLYSDYSKKYYIGFVQFLSIVSKNDFVEKGHWEWIHSQLRGENRDFFVCYLIEVLIEKDLYNIAWEAFIILKQSRTSTGKKGNHELTDLSTENIRNCYSLFLNQALQKPLLYDNGYIQSLVGLPLQGNDTRDAILYYENQIKKALAGGDIHDGYEQTKENLRSSLNSVGDLCFWIRLIVSKNLVRSKTEFYQELEEFYHSIKDAPMRWRIIDTMIKYEYPGVIDYDELTSDKTPLRVRKYFLKKLTEHGYLKKYLNYLLYDETHITYLSKLFNEFENEFDLAVEVLTGVCDLRSQEVYEKKTKEIIESNEWDKVFFSLTLLKNIWEKLSGKGENKVLKGKDQFLRENYFLILSLVREGVFSVQKDIDNFYTLLEYVDISFINALVENDNFFSLFKNKWDGSIDGFVKTFLTREFLMTNNPNHKLVSLLTIETDDKIQDFFYNFILKKRFGDKESIVDSLFLDFDLEEVSGEERNENIKKLNEKQKTFLKDKYIGNMSTGIDIPFEKFDIKKRQLILYCRKGDISLLPFTVLSKVLSEYIDRGYSKVFNDICIVPRYKGGYHEEFVSYIRHLDVQDLLFRQTTGIFANTIHLTHGSVFNEVYNSASILSAAVRGDPEKVRGIENYVSLSLKLDKREDRETPEGEELFDEDLIGTSKEILRAIQALEEKMLSEIE